MDKLLNALTGDTLVKLANIGFSGICIIIVVWTAFMIHGLKKEDPPSKPGLIKVFMGMCVVMFITSAWLTWDLARNGAKQVAAAKSETTEAKEVAENVLAAAKESQLLASNASKALDEINSKIVAAAAPAPVKESVTKAAADHSKFIKEDSARIERTFEAATKRLKGL